MANALSDVTPTSAPVGNGLVKLAENTIDNRQKYKKYVVEKQEAGEEPVSYEEFKRNGG